MWPSPGPPQGDRMMQQQASASQQKLIAVAIDKDRGSQAALKWTVESLCQRGQTLLLIHVRLKPPGSSLAPPPRLSQIAEDSKDSGLDMFDTETRELFLPFRVFCTRKDIQCLEILLEDTDVARALSEYVKLSAIEVLVVGAAAKGSLFRFKLKDISAGVLKGVPDFCNVYVISKGKISTTRSATRPAPVPNSVRNQIFQQTSSRSNALDSSSLSSNPRGSQRPMHESTLHRHSDFPTMKSPFSHRRGPNGKLYELSSPESDISFVNSGRQSIDNMFPSFSDDFEDGPTPPRLSGFSDFDNRSYDSMNIGRRSVDTLTPPELSPYASLDSDTSMSHNTAGAIQEDVDAEMRRLKQELKQTMEMYSSACKEALTAKQKALELQRWKMEEQRKLEEARLSEEAALALAEKEKAKSRAAIEHAEAARRIAELESQKRVDAEMKALKEAQERDTALHKLSNSDVRYRRYSIEEIETATDYFEKSRKIGEGGYGPVYKCYLDHTPVAVKVLRPDAAQGRSQFHQEIEVLSCIRHPNMVLLLGACPDYGCLVYEYMSNGSLEDRLMQRGKSPPLPWQHRFRIAAEITTGLLFLHQTKPEPIVHRDLKPGNILLDRNLVSKISDVGLARLVPPSVADTVTQYRMTSTAGTFCYIDPEYQQTGMLGVKSDVYSLGIIYLQILTAKPPMGLTHHVERAIENGTFDQMLDPSVADWPVEEALCLAKMALKCSELRRKDRPDLGNVVMPELERLRTMSEEKECSTAYTPNRSPNHSQVSVTQDEMSYPQTPAYSGYDSSRSRSSTVS